MPSERLDWSEPLDWLPAVTRTAGDCVLLYSSLRTPDIGRYSLLAFDPLDTAKANDFAVFSAKLSADQPRYENNWFGYLGYGLKNMLEKLPEDEQGAFCLPGLWMTRFNSLLVFDHTEQTLTLHQQVPRALPSPSSMAIIEKPTWVVGNIASNMTRASYLKKVEQLLEAIHRGDLYQANLTRKFSGTLSGSYDPAVLFARLCATSPAPYSAFLRLGDSYILSSSPELFLQVDANGRAITRPIKGSAGRSTDPAEDARIRSRLQASEKDRTENLMIVDLMRNDLARSCELNSVTVEKLFEVTSYATVHHLSSTITGQKRDDASTLDVVKNCFPPGSMTGAPKIKAIKWCTELERLERGVYSGAIGWFGGDGSCELSVVIRTLILQDNRFEFQVGGGIVADSNPKSEWQETLIKARGLARMLGLDEGELEAL